MNTYTYSAAAWMALGALGIGVPIIAYWWLHDSVGSALREVLDVAPATELIMRIFLLLMISAGAGSLLLYSDPEWHFMEYVWAIAARLHGRFEQAFVNIILIALAIAVLAAVSARIGWTTKDY